MADVHRAALHYQYLDGSPRSFRGVNHSAGLCCYLFPSFSCCVTSPQAALLHRYLTTTTEAEVPKNVLNFVVNQDPTDPAYFQVIQRFPGPSGMVAHQSGAAYSAFVRAAQPLLAESLGVYLCKESDGKIGQALYPWGPKGEGGRDDMVVRVGWQVPRWASVSWGVFFPVWGLRACCGVCGALLVSMPAVTLTPESSTAVYLPLRLFICALVSLSSLLCPSFFVFSVVCSIGDDCATRLVYVPLVFLFRRCVWELLGLYASGT